MQSVALIDYGSGNLRSAEKALQKAAESHSRPASVVATDDPALIAAADLVVLPGVGAFAACMGALEARPGVVQAIVQAAQLVVVDVQSLEAHGEAQPLELPSAAHA